MYLEVRDSLQRRTANNKIKKIELTYKFREQRAEIERLENKNTLQNAWNLAIILALIMVILLVIGLYRNVKVKQKANKILQAKQGEILLQNQKLVQQQEEIISQRDAIERKNHILEDRNRLIQSSIKAAFAIQNALLPHQTKLKQLLKNYFVMYRPRDVVSGDFYWVKRVNKTVYVAVLDCTGHGVQGAFMSLIANTLLDKVLQEKHRLIPADILMQLHIEVRKALKAPKTGTGYGLDMGLIAFKPIDNQQFQVVFSGAKRSLYYILPSNPSEICETGNDRFSIGGNYQRKVQFTNYSMKLPKGTMLYLNTDGLSGQNNRRRRNFTSNKLKKLLISIHHLSMEEQKNKLNEVFDHFMMGTEQRDDMLMIGIKLSKNP